MKLRKIKVPRLKDRVETGPVQFNDDWPGLFVRGDNCFGYAMNLSILRDKIEAGQTITPLEMGSLEGLINLLGSSHETFPNHSNRPSPSPPPDDRITIEGKQPIPPKI